MSDIKLNMNIGFLKALQEKGELIFTPLPMFDNEEDTIKSCILDGHPIPGIVVQEMDGNWHLIHGHRWVQVAIKLWSTIPKEVRYKLPEISIDVVSSWHPAYQLY